MVVINIISPGVELVIMKIKMTMKLTMTIKMVNIIRKRTGDARELPSARCSADMVIRAGPQTEKWENLNRTKFFGCL